MYEVSIQIECLPRERETGVQREKDDCVSEPYLTKASVNLPGKADRPLLFAVIWTSNNKHLNEIPNGPMAISSGR